MPYLENWSEIQATFDAWWRGELKRPIIQTFSPSDSSAGKEAFDYWCFLKYKDDRDALRRQLDAFPDTAHFGGDAYPTMLPNLGPGVVAAFFSGYLNFDEVNQTAWFEQENTWEAVEAMTMREDNPWWQYMQEVTELTAEAAKDRFLVGVTDIGGEMDILASLRGTQQLLFDLIQEPDRIHAMRKRICDAWQVVYDRLRPPVARVQEGTSSWFKVWCRGDYSPLQCDFCAMISPDMLELFVAPDIGVHCERLDHAIFHLDGPGQLPHLDCLLDIPGMDGIQWVPGDRNPQCEDPTWYPMYEKVLEKGKLLLLQFFGDVEGIPRMLEQLPHRGLLLSVNLPNEEEARRFLDTVHRQI